MRRLDAVRGDTRELADTEWERGRAWAEVAQGRVSAGIDLLLAAAERARTTGRLLFEHRLLHTVVRLGDRRRAVTDRLEALRSVIATPLGLLAARHGSALAVSDVDGLEEVSEAYRASGYLLFAAEAAGQAADAAQRKQNNRRATRLATRSADLAALCESAVTPALVHLGTVTPLSAREREVALLIAQGATNKEISAQLVLSVRTVENHVGGVLTKLGVARRSDVAEALRADSTPQ
jgi:DNA-binding NarL/FixJ family response regulator